MPLRHLKAAVRPSFARLGRGRKQGLSRPAPNPNIAQNYSGGRFSAIPFRPCRAASQQGPASSGLP